MGKLFDENFELVDTPEKLKELQEQYSQYDLRYITLTAAKSRQEIRDWLERLWQQYEPYADRDFPEKTKKECHQRTWEMYLACTLLNRGFSLRKRGNGEMGGPDICLVVGNENIWIEAVAPTMGTGDDRVPAVQYGVVHDVPEEKMLLRLTTALEAKFIKYKEYRDKNLVEENESYIIAINRGSFLHLDPQIPLILKCLFGVGFQVVQIPKGETFWERRKEIKKGIGSPVSMEFFENSEHCGISAVIYCANDIHNSPLEKDTMGNNFVVVHNHLARNPIPEKLFGFGETWKRVDDEIIKI